MKRADTPRPRPPPGRMPHSPRTRSRWRARAVSSRSWAWVSGGRTRSFQVTVGSMRRARRSRPAAFWARAPWRTWSGVRVPPSRWVVWAAPLAARVICSGVRRNGESRRSTSMVSGTGASYASVQRAALVEGSTRGACRRSGGAVDQAASQGARPTRIVGTGVPVSSRRSSGCSRQTASIGAQTTPAPVSRASRTSERTASAGDGSSARRARSRPRTRWPARVSAEAARAVPAPPWSSRR